MTSQVNKVKVMITFDVAWERTVANKQTLFPVWGEKEERKAHKGIPMEGQEYTLRATKGVNMHPFPVIKIIKEDGTKYASEEEIKISIVSAIDKLTPPNGSCNACGGNPILTESKQYQLIKKKTDQNTYCKVRGGILEFTKVQIGCCTGARGHGQPFCLRAEFVTEGSPLKGRVVYSLPIDVGAKGPFAKIFCINAAATVASSSTENLIEDSDTKMAIKAITIPSYPGAEEMVNLLKKLNLEKYIDAFTEQEVDIQAFLQLTDEDLNAMGITKVGPKVKILKEINRIKEQMKIVLPSTPTPCILPPLKEISESEVPSIPTPIEYSNTFASPMVVPASSDFSFKSVAQDDAITLADPPSKRRKILESYASNGNLAELEEKAACVYIYLSNVIVTNNVLKKTLFMVKSELPRHDTELVVQQIQMQIVGDLIQKGKFVYHEGRAQMMLTLQPDKNDWIARAPPMDQVWNFKKGDYIKIDNHHNVDVSINVHYFFVPQKSGSSDKPYVEDFRSPKKYPTLFPGGSLEISVDDKSDGRLALAAELDFEPQSETFAVTKNGKIISPDSMEASMHNETCNFSFKRKKDNMKKAESFDDFQKEIFLSKCLDPTIF